MSDLTATNCGCSNNCGNGGVLGSGSSCIWIILLLFCCNGNGNGSGLFGGSSCGCDGGNNGCDWLIWILLLSCFCGNNNSCC